MSQTAFGIHSYQGMPRLSAGSIRLNCYPLWRTMNPQSGEFLWATADNEMQRVADYGFTDVVFTFCGTPPWAARGSVANPDREYWGPQSTAAPDMDAWRLFVRAFVARYADRITAYETWNEATSPYLWQGKPDEMAQMTKILHAAVRDLDPTARVVSANSQMGEQPAWFDSFFPRYMRGLASRGWPVDAVSVHTYAGSPTNDEGLVRRTAELDRLVEAVAPLGLPSRIEFWDTETNYLGTADGPTQQALVARSFLESWRHGVTRTYWYMWVQIPDPWLGVQFSEGSPAVHAFDTLEEWTRGSTFDGCSDASDGVRVCLFTRPDGSRFRIAYSVSAQGSGTVSLGQPTPVCVVTEPCRTLNGPIPVSFAPVRIG